MKRVVDPRDELDGYTVSFTSLLEDIDATPFMKGRLLCPARPHPGAERARQQDRDVAGGLAFEHPPGSGGATNRVPSSSGTPPSYSHAGRDPWAPGVPAPDIVAPIRHPLSTRRGAPKGLPCEQHQDGLRRLASTPWRRSDPLRFWREQRAPCQAIPPSRPIQGRRVRDDRTFRRSCARRSSTRHRRSFAPKAGRSHLGTRLRVPARIQRSANRPWRRSLGRPDPNPAGRWPRPPTAPSVQGARRSRSCDGTILRAAVRGQASENGCRYDPVQRLRRAVPHPSLCGSPQDPPRTATWYPINLGPAV